MTLEETLHEDLLRKIKRDRNNEPYNVVILASDRIENGRYSEKYSVSVSHILAYLEQERKQHSVKSRFGIIQTSLTGPELVRIAANMGDYIDRITETVPTNLFTKSSLAK